MTYLAHAKYIRIDPVLQEVYANLDMIDRYRLAFEKDTFFGKMIDGYFHYLEQRHLEGKMKIHSVRLALATAVNFLRYCQHCKVGKPSKKMLHDYLWCFWGQKATLTSFIHYINRVYSFQFDIHNTTKPALSRPYTSREILKQRLIRILREQKEGISIDRDKLIRIAIGYLHWIDIPKEIDIGFSKVKYSSGNGYIHLGGRVFYLPKTI